MRRPAARATQSVAPPPVKPRRGRPPKLQAARSESLELAVTVDRKQREMVDEYGELDRRMQVNAPDVARYDVLKRAIKSWFDRMPPDADGVIEGQVYRLHLSARERERRVRSMRDLVDTIGLDKFLEMASVPIGALEDLLGKTRAAALITEARTGSRRIKAVPKRAAGEK
jgi:hypothetical protein